MHDGRVHASTHLQRNSANTWYLFCVDNGIHVLQVTRLMLVPYNIDMAK